MLSLFSLVAFAGSKFTTITYDVRGFEKNDTLVLRWGIIGNVSNPLIAEHPITQLADTLIIDEPRLLFLSLKHKPGTLELLIQPGEAVVISGKLRKGYSSHYATNNFSQLKVTGADVEEEYLSMINHLAYYRDSLCRVPAGYEPISQRYNTAIAEGDHEAIKALRNGTFEEQNYMQMVSSQESEVSRYILDMVLTYRDSYMAPMLLLRLYDNIDERFRSIYQQLYPEAKHTYYGNLVRRCVFPKSLNEKIAPQLKVLTKDGDVCTLNFANRNAKYTLVEFWATFCGPCRKQFPNLLKLYQRYHERGLEVVTISTDSDTPEWMRYIKENPFPWTTDYFDFTHQSPDIFHFNKIPYNLLIDSGGMIVAENLHGVELSEYLESFF